MAGRIALLMRHLLLPRRRQDFVRDERGVTAVEFGLLALPFFSILGAILETSLVFLSGHVLESAVNDASRQIRTGQVQQASVTAAGFKTMVCDHLYGLFPDCNGLHVEVREIGNFTTLSYEPPIDPACKKDCKWTRPEVFVPGKGSSTISVQVHYKWPVVLNFAIFSLATLPDGTRLLGAAAVFRNEPFS